MTQVLESARSERPRLAGRVRLSDIFIVSAQAALELQADDGSFPAGWNGPYHDQETPVRNTAHWFMTLLKVYQITGDEQFLAAAERGLDYLLSSQVRPMRATFYCRTNPEKDFSNRLIGQAWTFQALVAAAEAFDRPELRALAAEVFLLHPFVEKAGLWRYINVDGSYLGYDRTFNHQLMFAAAGALIENDPKGPVGSQIKRFLDRLQSFHLRSDKSGRITHSIPVVTESTGLQMRVRRQLEDILARANRPSPAYLRMKEIGYHAFNLYGFCMLKQRMPDHSLWQTAKFQSVVQFVNTAAYVEGLENNKYGFPYNPPGFEVALAQQVFAPLFATPIKPASWWVEQQIRRHFDRNAGLMNRATDDPNTLAARIYEAVDLDDLEIDLG